ncbi:MAG: flagellar hook-basal body complex protein FliE [Deltaproteobacteria bacterium]|nr:flagellar hook-basal body complex protein FliE [Deltaproteobacteria bacterium]
MDELKIQRGFQDRNILRDSGAVRKKGTGFSGYVKQALKDLNNLETQADQSVEQMVQAKTGIHETMIALQKADISLRLLLQIRNKALEAYREVMHMQF